jgi:Tfp pilus assembly protein PilV
VRSSTARWKDEAGSSLVEVTVAMVVLTLAVVPMVGMLEAGFRAATSSGEYDAARALAGAELEEARALPYDRPGGASDSAVERYAPPGPPDQTEDGFTLSVRTAFVDGELSETVGSPSGQMRIEVLVGWENDRSYSTTGFVSGRPP